MNAALGQATALLSGALPIRVHSVRAAAWVTRSVLEDLIRRLVEAKECEPGYASTRTLLGCIDVLYADEAPHIASLAQYAWDGLSQASHHHSYELAPTHAEVTALVELVDDVATYSTLGEADGRTDSGA